MYLILFEIEFVSILIAFSCLDQCPECSPGSVLNLGTQVLQTLNELQESSLQVQCERRRAPFEGIFQMVWKTQTFRWCMILERFCSWKDSRNSVLSHTRRGSKTCEERPHKEDMQVL